MNKATAYVTIKSGMFHRWAFSFYYGCFDEFKQELLKRFGNLRGTSKGNRLKENIKKLIRSAKSFEDIREIDCGGWGFEIRVNL